MRIAIYGLSKTGTTALYSKLKEEMPRSTACYFEPGAHHLARLRRQQGLARLGIGRSRPQLVKFLPFNPGAELMLDRFGSFDRAILITRDPRDRLLSDVLYRAYDSPIARDDAVMADYLGLLEAKERDPHSVALLALLERVYGPAFDLAAWQADYAARSIAQPLAFGAAHPELFQFRYEDLIERNFTALNAYLGLPLAGEVVVDQQLSRVIRTTGSGDWRNWFTLADIAALRPLLQPYLDRYYPEADWAVASVPQIDPRHGSGYVRRIVNERRAMDRLPLLAPSGTAGA